VGTSQRSGVQYLPIRCTERCAEAGIKLSVASVGDSYDEPHWSRVSSVRRVGCDSSQRAWSMWSGVRDPRLGGLVRRPLAAEPTGGIPSAEFGKLHCEEQEAPVVMVAALKEWGLPLAGKAGRFRKPPRARRSSLWHVVGWVCRVGRVRGVHGREARKWERWCDIDLCRRRMSPTFSGTSYTRCDATTFLAGRAHRYDPRGLISIE
jgi:hypothetical protein